MVQRVALYVAIIVVAGVLGANVYNSVVDAPSWGSAIPASLETARRYFAVGNPGRFFRATSPLGEVSTLVVLVVCWRFRASVRTLAAAAFALIVAADVFTFIYFYPRNEIMFTQALDVAAATRAWREWSAMNYVRNAMALASLLCELAALSRVERLMAQR
jgi:hypothetical protein